MAWGKWPSTYGNAFFTDSSFLLHDIVDMIQNNMIKYLERNNHEDDHIIGT
jgi:hypothetical protein